MPCFEKIKINRKSEKIFRIISDERQNSNFIIKLVKCQNYTETKKYRFYMLNKNLSYVFSNEICSKLAKRSYVTNVTEVRDIDKNWISNLLEIIDYALKKTEKVINILVVIDNFSKNGFGVPL